MASSNYNEVTHTQGADVNSLDPLYKWDTHFPERLSKLHLHQDTTTSPTARRQRTRRNRNTGRFKTQPITFDEIKEVDEESKDAPKDEAHDKIEGIKNEFEAFSRSMDGLLPGGNHPRREKTREPSTDSNKENNPSSEIVGCPTGGGKICEVPSASSVLSVKSPATESNSSPSSSSSSSGNSSSSSSAAVTTHTIDPVSGMKIPAGLPSDRDAGRGRRRPRKKNKGIAEEAPEGDKNGGGELQQVG